MFRTWPRLWTRKPHLPRNAPSVRPRLEALETRLVPAPITVSDSAGLRAALANTSIDTIFLDPGTYTTRAQSGGGQFNVTHNVILEAASGGSASNIFVDGVNTDRVFNVTGGITAEFDDMTIQHGSVTGSNGAGILAASGAIVTLRNSVVTANTSSVTSASSGGGGEGGGIAVNGAASGGSRLTLIDSTVSFNTASGGSAASGGVYGGGIYATFTNVTLETSNILNNTVAASGGNFHGGGGGIYAGVFLSSASLTLTDCTVDGNSASHLTNGYGGGIETLGADTITITRSTISNNSAVYGGGIAAPFLAVGPNSLYNAVPETVPAAGASINVKNSTIYGNSATSTGGGIYIGGTSTLALTNDTVTANSAVEAGGIEHVSLTQTPKITDSIQNQVPTTGVTLLNTIVARNTLVGNGGGDPDLAGAYTSQGHNLIGIFVSGGSNSGFVDGTNGDQVGKTGAAIDPGFSGGLQNNGGPTKTVALLPTSNAVDKGSDSVLGTLTTDQRGAAFFRRSGTAVDIGAYEYQLSYRAIGAGPGGGPEVKVYKVNPDGTNGALVGDFFAFDPLFRGGVHVAVADINGDGTPDIIVGAGPGGGPEVEVIDGTLLADVEPPGTMVLNPMTGKMEDIGGEIIGGPTAPPGQGQTSAVLAAFYAYAPDFAGGVYVAAADINGDGVPDIITGAGPGGGPHVEVIDGTMLNDKLANGEIVGGGGQPAVPNGPVIDSFYAYDPRVQCGVTVAAAIVNGKPEIITGAGPTDGPHVEVIDGTKLHNTLANGEIAGGGGETAADIGTTPNAVISSFYAFNPKTFTGGVFVAATVNAEGQLIVLVGQGPGTAAATPAGQPANGSQVEILNGSTLHSTPNQNDGEFAPGALLQSFPAYPAGFLGGADVAADAFNTYPFGDVLTGAGPGGGPQVDILTAANLTPLDLFFAFAQAFHGGAFVGSGSGAYRITK